MRVPHVIFAVSSVNKNIAKNDWLSAAQIHAKQMNAEINISISVQLLFTIKLPSGLIQVFPTNKETGKNSGRCGLGVITDFIGSKNDLLDGEFCFIELNFHDQFFIAGCDAFHTGDFIFQTLKVHGAVGTSHIGDVENFFHFYSHISLIGF